MSEEGDGVVDLAFESCLWLKLLFVTPLLTSRGIFTLTGMLLAANMLNEYIQVKCFVEEQSDFIN